MARSGAFGDKQVQALGAAIEVRLIPGQIGDALDLAMMIDSLIKTRIAEAAGRDPTTAPETLEQRQREPDAIAKAALYGNLRELYRRDVPDETLDRSKPETGAILEP